MLADHPTLHHAIAFALWWLVFGTLTWFLLFTSSIPEEVRLKRIEAGRSFSFASAFIASLMLIVAWPVAFVAFIGGAIRMRKVRGMGR